MRCYPARLTLGIIVEAYSILQVEFAFVSDIAADRAVSGTRANAKRDLLEEATWRV